MKTPMIYDTINHGDREERVVNQEATLSAREKQRLIKERFRSWIFTDSERTERLVRLYNDIYTDRSQRLLGQAFEFNLQAGLGARWLGPAFAVTLATAP